MLKAATLGTSLAAMPFWHKFDRVQLRKILLYFISVLKVSIKIRGRSQTTNCIRNTEILANKWVHVSVYIYTNRFIQIYNAMQAHKQAHTKVLSKQNTFT